jgi:hypothetical protein
MDDGIISQFLLKNLKLDRIIKLERVADTDHEPICQAADICAYLFHRQELRNYRLAQKIEAIPDPLIKKSLAIFNPRPLCSLNVDIFLYKQFQQPDVRKVIIAAQYVLTHHGLSALKPEFVAEHFVTPEEFLMRAMSAPMGTRYLPILKDGVLREWKGASS